MSYLNDPARYKKGLMLTKDNRLVRLHGNMTPTSYKLINYILWMAVREGHLDNLTANATEVVKLLHIGDHSFGEQLKAECIKAAKTVVEFQDKDDPEGKWLVISLVPKIKYDNGTLTATVNPEVAPYINELRGNFTPLELETLNTCGTYPAMRLYEVCMSWKRAGKVCYTTEEWRGLLGATGKSYNAFAQFKRRAWEPSVRAVNERTELRIEPEYIKEGRKTVKILVHIQDLGFGKEEVQQMSLVEPPVSDLLKQMVDCGFARKTAQSYIDACGAEYCEAQLKLTLAGKRAGHVKNTAGYLRRALDEDYAGERETIEKIKAAEEQAKLDNARRDREAWELFHGRPRREGDAVADDDAREAGEKCLALGIDERQVMAWLEKHPPARLGKAADMAAGMDTKHAIEYIEAVLRYNSAKA